MENVNGYRSWFSTSCCSGSPQNLPLVFTGCCQPRWRMQWRCPCGGSATPCLRWTQPSARSSWWATPRKSWVPQGSTNHPSGQHQQLIPSFSPSRSCVGSSYPGTDKQDRISQSTSVCLPGRALVWWNQGISICFSSSLGRAILRRRALRFGADGWPTESWEDAGSECILSVSKPHPLPSSPISLLGIFRVLWPPLCFIL